MNAMTDEIRPDQSAFVNAFPPSSSNGGLSPATSFDVVYAVLFIVAASEIAASLFIVLSHQPEAAFEGGRGWESPEIIGFVKPALWFLIALVLLQVWRLYSLMRRVDSGMSDPCHFTAHLSGAWKVFDRVSRVFLVALLILSVEGGITHILEIEPNHRTVVERLGVLLTLLFGTLLGWDVMFTFWQRNYEAREPKLYLTVKQSIREFAPRPGIRIAQRVSGVIVGGSFWAAAVVDLQWLLATLFSGAFFLFLFCLEYSPDRGQPRWKLERAAEELFGPFLELWAIVVR